ncbi:SUF system NifU family Fe-S cluster assembly protein, partial [bacterium]|nr:SUF system NifU family Fe-S cluster assembly protein [bacterium]
MTATDNLYHAVILDHARAPRNRREISDADRSAVGHNPLCGDRINVFLQMQDERIKQATFVNEGCAISTASASVMTQLVEGKTQAEAVRLYA